MSGRLDDEKLETLKGWGTGLAADGRDELRAAGKAILILIEEIDHLQVDVWHARQTGAVPAEQDGAESIDTTLRSRLRRLTPPRPLESG